jgi:nucleotide-binding universal stress UspA family protein
MKSMNTRFQIRNILVPTDFSEPSNRAADAAVEFVLLTGGEIDLLYVEGIATYGISADLSGSAVAVQFLEEHEEAMRERLDVELERIRKRGVVCHSLFVKGAPADRIIETAAKRHSDLIIMGTHGRAGLSHLFIGSVAERVIRSAPCPVLTFREPEKVSRGRAKVSKKSSRPKKKKS